jgi:hypothetical protein
MSMHWSAYLTLALAVALALLLFPFFAGLAGTKGGF